MRNLLTTSLLAGALATGACGDNDPGIDGTLLVVNESSFSINRLHIVPIDSPSWGSNLLGNDALQPGEEVVIGLSCDFYDALLIDDLGVECELRSVDMCFNNATFVITNNTCTVFDSAARAAANAAAGAAAPTAGAL